MGAPALARGGTRRAFRRPHGQPAPVRTFQPLTRPAQSRETAAAMVRALTLTAFIALLLAVPTAGLAKGQGNSGKGKAPPSGGTTSPKCEQVPPGGKGPLRDVAWDSCLGPADHGSSHLTA